MINIKQKIVPCLWFDKEAKEAAQFYCSIFRDSKINNITRLTDTPSGDCEIVSFTLLGQNFMVFGTSSPFKLNEAISFVVNCDTQEEVDYYWEKLSAVPEAEQCGWLKDKFGLSWQIVPTALEKLLQDSNPKSAARVSQAILKMKKLDIAALEKAKLEK